MRGLVSLHPMRSTIRAQVNQTSAQTNAAELNELKKIELVEHCIQLTELMTTLQNNEARLQDEKIRLEAWPHCSGALS